MVGELAFPDQGMQQILKSSIKSAELILQNTDNEYETLVITPKVSG